MPLTLGKSGRVDGNKVGSGVRANTNANESMNPFNRNAKQVKVNQILVSIQCSVVDIIGDKKKKGG